MRNWPGVVPRQPALDDSRQRESGIGDRPHAENAPYRDALREPGRSAGVSGSLGTALGRHAHPWHDETAGGGHVQRRKTALAPSSSCTLPLLPIRRTRRSYGLVGGDGAGLLRLATVGV